MKKTYIAPEIMEQKIQLSNIICVSGTLDSEQTIDDANRIGSRGGSFWDDEDEE
ncbi:MAG: hypothetical protein J6I52_01795 [Prevotella sp.]|nr:hypothetical protein [Prevotella sp.]